MYHFETRNYIICLIRAEMNFCAQKGEYYA